MSDSEEHILGDQPLTMLSLFRKREVNALALNPIIYQKLYRALCCTICMQIYTNPVYLKCSHRFCKQCIQKYIRSNTKKSCPNCRGGLTTKRDLHLDYGVQSLIAFGFGDVRKFAKELETLQRQETEGMRRKVETRAKGRRDDDQYNTGLYGIKKLKSNDGEQVRRGRKRLSQVKVERVELQRIDSKTQLKQQKQPSVMSPEKPSQLAQIKPKKQDDSYTPSSIPSTTLKQVIKVRTMPRRKPKPQFIQIRSSSSGEDRDKLKERDRDLSIQERKDDHKMDVEQEIHAIPAQNKQKSIIREMLDQSEERRPIETQTDVEVRQSKKVLLEQFGPDYLYKIMEICPFDFTFHLRLKNLMSSPLTPCCVFSMRISHLTPLSSLIVFLSQNLNTSKQSIRLWAKSEQGMDELMNPAMKVREMNGKYWKGAKGIGLWDMADLIKGIQGQTLDQSKIIYFSVQFSRI